MVAVPLYGPCGSEVGWLITGADELARAKILFGAAKVRGTEASTSSTSRLFQCIFKQTRIIFPESFDVRGKDPTNHRLQKEH